MKELIMDNVNEKIIEVKNLIRRVSKNRNNYYYELGKVITESRKSPLQLVLLPINLYKKYKSIEPIENSFDIECLSTLSEIEKKTALENEIKRLNRYIQLDPSSGQYILGREAYLTFASRRNVITAPYRFIKSYCKIKNSRRNNEVKTDFVSVGKIEDAGETILFVATNGAGLGHLTRSLAVAKRIKRIEPELNIIFLTTSLALTIVRRAGFLAYCIPSRELISGISSNQWNNMLKMQLKELFSLYSVSAAVFDGATPYASITATIAKEDVKKIWIKRGGDKNSEIAQARKEYEKFFDIIIVPGEADYQMDYLIDNSDNTHKYIKPVVFLDDNELWTRDEVRTFFKIPKGKKLAYIQLGAGNINDINSDISKIVNEIRKHKDVMMAVGESLIGSELKIIEDDIIVIKDYPNSKYFNGFDFAVSACGYNSFHELLFFEVPTLFIPNMLAKTDDQYGRAIKVQNNGAGIVAIETDNVSDAINRLCDEETNNNMREKLKLMKFSNGALEAAQIIIDEVRTGNG